MRHYRAKEDVRQLRLLVGANTLRRYLGDTGFLQQFEHGQGMQPLAFSPTSLASQWQARLLLEQMQQTQSANPLPDISPGSLPNMLPNMLQLHRHALGLLASELHSLEFKTQTGAAPLRARDMQQAQAVRTWLERHAGHCPTEARRDI